MWGDLDAQFKQDLSKDLEVLWGVFEKLERKVNQDIKELENRNVSLAQRVYTLETKLKEFEEEKSKGFFSFRR